MRSRDLAILRFKANSNAVGRHRNITGRDAAKDLSNLVGHSLAQRYAAGALIIHPACAMSAHSTRLAAGLQVQDLLAACHPVEMAGSS